MGLRDLRLRPSYRSDEANIGLDFIVPCLRAAWAYDRATGYFSGQLFPTIVQGLEPFIRRGGKIRLVSSPQFTTDDADAIAQGYATREFVLQQRASDALDELSTGNSKVYSQLAWLVANNALDIKIAIPRREPLLGIYHEKFGVFTERDDAVAFSGSLNETYAALYKNFEYIDVFTSWTDNARTSEKRGYFERLWSGTTSHLEVFDFPEALKRRLIREAPTEYPEGVGTEIAVPANERKPKSHQIAAIDAWERNGRRGILEMATGSGKTFTSLTAAQRLLRENQIGSVVILAPFIAIADQWRAEVEQVLGVDPIVCHSMSSDWRSNLRLALALGRFEKAKLCVIALYDTASGDEFRERISQLPQPALIIADEVHNVTKDLADSIFLEQYEWRLGLSATPERYLDERGTQRTNDYFNGVLFRFTLAEAIAMDVLVPYLYYPIVCRPDYSIGRLNAVKFQKFTEVFESTPAANDGYALIYCQPQQLDDVKSWLGRTQRRPIHTFTAEENLQQRRDILQEFGRGDLFALVAMRCLDEGVDVPPTRSAFLLGSSENPRQFVQRRGRVLRKYPGKHNASIYDFIYLQRPETKTAERETRKELTRFGEFALSAMNSKEAFGTIEAAADSLGIHLRDYVTQGV